MNFRRSPSQRVLLGPRHENKKTLAMQRSGEASVQKSWGRNKLVSLRNRRKASMSERKWFEVDLYQLEGRARVS